MLNNNRRGFFEWIVQRVSAILMGAYAIFIAVFFFRHAPMNFSVWNDLFSHLVMKIATFIVLIAILWHAWIGLWTVLTDYVKCGYLRLLLEVLVILVLISYLVWCVDALW